MKQVNILELNHTNKLNNATMPSFVLAAYCNMKLPIKVSAVYSTENLFRHWKHFGIEQNGIYCIETEKLCMLFKSLNRHLVPSHLLPGHSASFVYPNNLWFSVEYPLFRECHQPIFPSLRHINIFLHQLYATYLNKKKNIQFQKNNSKSI